MKPLYVGALGAVAALVGMTTMTGPDVHGQIRWSSAATSDWTTRVARVDATLGQNDLESAQRTGPEAGDRSSPLSRWRDAYGAALRSRGWEGLVAAGDAALRIEAQMGRGTGMRSEARRAYLAAFLRARKQRSGDGLSRIAAGFARLGDDEVAAHVRRLAEARS